MLDAQNGGKTISKIPKIVKLTHSQQQQDINNLLINQLMLLTLPHALILIFVTTKPKVRPLVVEMLFIVICVH